MAFIESQVYQMSFSKSFTNLLDDLPGQLNLISPWLNLAFISCRIGLFLLVFVGVSLYWTPLCFLAWVGSFHFLLTLLWNFTWLLTLFNTIGIPQCNRVWNGFLESVLGQTFDGGLGEGVQTLYKVHAYLVFPNVGVGVGGGGGVTIGIDISVILVIIVNFF